MKYLKTYKLFENYSKELYLKNESEWSNADENTKKISILYNTTTLPELPENLEILICHSKGIEKLPTLPKTLKELHCQNNNLERLPELPESLRVLNSSYNQLIELPKLPNGLNNLNIRDNNIKNLTKLPKKLYICRIGNNPLERLPEGMSKNLLYFNDNDWIKENIFKWLKNEPSCYYIIKDFLTDIQQKYFEKNGAEGIEDLTQFGMFGLKNN